ncbi:lasso peptide biosynthesis PqqD family chaperone [Actinosynnema sp. NPDC023587]|uniref:lasso peptide biosynthesis PqqD family chaperone n=1 Tax=Actinosynnema sp. NPDC023587 TaxID=3154695 RepID=UPI003400AC86
MSTGTEGGSVLLNKRTGRYWQVNLTGAHILDRLFAGEPADGIASDIATHYGIDAAAVRADIAALTDNLLGAGLVETS